MGTGYTRNDTANNIADGNVINASDLDGEFDAVQAAFNASTGHSHDGTTGEGPQIDASGIANNAVALGTKTTGNYVASLTAGALIDLQNNSGEGATPTIDVDLTELTDMTETAVGADELVILDGGTAQKRKAISEIPLSIFNNDSSFSTTTGTVTSVGTTGTVNGITLTGTVTSSGNLTLGGTLGNITFSQLDGGVVTTSSESFADNDTTLMTSAAINDRIESFGYTTNTGDVTLAGSQSLTNKTIDVDNNTVSNIEVDNFKSGVLDTDISSVAGTDTTLASAKAIKTYVDAQVGGVSTDVVNDTTPQLGGNLDLNSSDITGTGNIDNTGTVTTDGLTVAGNTDISGGTIKLDGNFPTGTECVALGGGTFNSITTASNNIAIGHEALYSNDVADDNTAVGHHAGRAISGATEVWNTAVGTSAMEIVGGNNNAAIGRRALYGNNATGGNSIQHNVAIGNFTLYNDIDGHGNTAVGHQAGYNFNPSSTGFTYNTFVGYKSGYDITTGTKNVILGSYDGNNVASSYTQALNISTTSNNIVLSDGDGNIRLHSESMGRTTICGSAFSFGTHTSEPSGLKLHYETDTGIAVVGSFNKESGQNSGNSELLFYTNSGAADSTEKMRIDSSGNVLVGKTSQGLANVGFEASSAGNVQITRSAASPLVVNRLSSDGDIVSFRKDGSTVGSIGNRSTALQVQSNGGVGVDLALNNIFPLKSGSLTDDAVTLGDGTRRFKDLYLSGGAYIGGTAAANKLDDYEEGTWTPTLRFGGSTTGISYSSQLGRYTKIGDTVHVQVFIALSSKGSASGAVDISGLPFGQKSGGFHCFGINVFNWASGTNYPVGQVNQNESVVQIKQLGTDTSFTNSAFSNTTGLRMSFMYITG